MAVEIHRSADRFRTEAPGRSTRHSFSFGAHYDPANTRHGLLVMHNEDRVRPGHGYPDHPHQDLEIVTWVLDGALTHADSAGHSGVVVRGLVQAMSAGSGVMHAETVAPDVGTTRFVQTWVRPDEPGLRPAYSSAGVDDVLSGAELVPVASGGHPDAPARIGTRSATLYAARLTAGGQVTLPDGTHAHLFVAIGAVDLEGAAALGEGDAARLSGETGRRLTAHGTAEILVWSFA